MKEDKCHGATGDTEMKKLNKKINILSGLCVSVTRMKDAFLISDGSAISAVIGISISAFIRWFRCGKNFSTA